MQFFEQQLENVDQGQAFIAVFSETPYNPNPLPAVDYAIQNYVNDNSYNAYVEEWLDNPWLKVVILGINNLHYDFDPDGYAVYQQPLQTAFGNAHLFVIFANPQIANPKPLLDNVVYHLVNNNSYNAFVELNNPWVRIVIIGLNNLNYINI